MKKILYFVLIFIFAVMPISSVYGRGYTEASNYVPNEFPTVNYNVIKGEYNLKLKINDEAPTHNIKMKKHGYYNLYYISLEDFCNAVGGSYKWNPKREDELLYRAKYHDGYCFSVDFEIFNEKFKLQYGGLDIQPDLTEEATEHYMHVMHFDDENWTAVFAYPAIEDVCVLYLQDGIYVDARILRNILPRIGYLVNIDSSDKVMNITSYDYEKERDLMIEKFPDSEFGTVTQSGNNKGYNYYEKEYDGKLQSPTHSYCYYYADIFDEQSRSTIGCDSTYFKNNNGIVKASSSSMYDVDDKDSTYFKKYYKAAFKLKEISNYWDIKINYDDDLKAYVLYTNNTENEGINPDCSTILVIREFDGMILYERIC